VLATRIGGGHCPKLSQTIRKLKIKLSANCLKMGGGKIVFHRFLVFKLYAKVNINMIACI
jgi:hypothetical protein